MCQDAKKSFSLSLNMYVLMAQSLMNTMKDIMQNDEWCQAHKALSLSFMLKAALPIVQAVQLYCEEVQSFQPLEPLLEVERATTVLLDLAIVAVDAKQLMANVSDTIQTASIGGLGKESLMAMKDMMDSISGGEKILEDELEKLKVMEDELDRVLLDSKENELPEQADG